MQAVFLARGDAGELLQLPGDQAVFPKLARRYEAAAQQTASGLNGQPLSIVDIGLASGPV